jgi:glutamate dehydrogenase
MVSYFEQVQNNMNFYWSASEVDTKLKDKITNAASGVFTMAQNHKVMLRTGAYMIAMKRILDAMKARGEI